MSNDIENIRNAMSQYGIICQDSIIFDEQLHRFKPKEDKDKTIIIDFNSKCIISSKRRINVYKFQSALLFNFLKIIVVEQLRI